MAQGGEEAVLDAPGFLGGVLGLTQLFLSAFAFGDVANGCTG